MLLTNCASDENSIPIDSSLTYIEYDLTGIEDPFVTGYTRFIKAEDASITIQVILSGFTPSDNNHPTHIHYNTAVEGGSIAITLNPVDGNTGTSTTNFTTLDDGTPITYEELNEFDGHLNVHENSNNLDDLVMQGDIGQNDLTGISNIYGLPEFNVSGIAGTAKFSERRNGEALAVIELVNTLAGTTHPVDINTNSALEGGVFVFSFNDVDGETGISQTNVSQLDDGSEFGFDELANINGHVEVYLDPMNMQLISQGDIGTNELTGTAVTYNLNEVGTSGIQGTATFNQRLDGTALAVIELENTMPGASYPSHIHQNDMVTTGPVIFTLNNIDGNTGMSQTNVSQLDDGTPFNYVDVVDVDGYINVHLSDTQLDVIIAQGNIGSNF